MKKLVLPIILFIFITLASTSNITASSDCKQEYRDWRSVCEQSVAPCNECQGNDKNPVCEKVCNDAVDKCIRAGDTLDACLGVDRKTWALQPQMPGHLTCDEWKKLSMLGAAQNCPNLSWQPESGGAWCSVSIEEGVSRTGKVPPDYIFDFNYNSCTSTGTADDVRLFKTGLSSTSKTTSASKNSSAYNSTGKSVEKGSPFNIFGINPYQTWLNLVELANAGALMKTGAFDRFTESTILHSVGTEPYWERDARAKTAYDLFYKQATERFVKLQGKTGLTEINDSTKKTLIEAVKDSVIIKKDAATIDLHPINGQKGVLEDNGDWPMLKYGAIDVIVQPQNGRQFEIQTPNAEIMVIGTEFSVIYDQKKGETLVAVYKGRVEIKASDGKTITISPDGDKPEVAIIAQKLSVTKIAVAGLVIIAAIGGILFFLRKKESRARKH